MIFSFGFVFFRFGDGGIDLESSPSAGSNSDHIKISEKDEDIIKPKEVLFLLILFLFTTGFPKFSGSVSGR